MQIFRQTKRLNIAYFSVADPDLGSGVFFIPGSGMGKNPDPVPGSEMNTPDNFSRGLEQKQFKVKNTEILRYGRRIFFTLNPGWKSSDPG